MKPTLYKKANPLMISFFFLFLVSIIPAFLYTIDWISTSLYHFFSNVLAIVFYALMALLLCHTIKKRQLVYALALLAILCILYLYTQPFDLANTLFFSGKLLFFLIVVLILKKKIH